MIVRLNETRRSGIPRYWHVQLAGIAHPSSGNEGIFGKKKILPAILAPTLQEHLSILTPTKRLDCRNASSFCLGSKVFFAFRAFLRKSFIFSVVEATFYSTLAEYKQ